jgi:hypothetical protein
MTFYLRRMTLMYRSSVPDPDPLVRGTGTVPYGSEDPDPLTDQYQNVMDPQHW